MNHRDGADPAPTAGRARVNHRDGADPAPTAGRSSEQRSSWLTGAHGLLRPYMCVTRGWITAMGRMRTRGGDHVRGHGGGAGQGTAAPCPYIAVLYALQLL
ncbi:hypothetical protein [Candidatus Chloroploca sp. Khr17]|uniref:hypothetical protein n=1 Tax=Candidatus Chloroploca sp. Khr17 TaxID=2496869 RepID=UPI00101B811D|nr:hypothetical protein [Candidatus Chloroploca sp. Khr17]